MGKTKRNASRWMETRFKLGDTQYPEENETYYFNGRYQAKMRNGNRSNYSMEIDPLSYKVISWREYTGDTKVMAKRAARRNAKILVKLEAFIIMDEIWQEEQAAMWEDDDWYEDDSMSFDYSYSDEAYEYAEQRRQDDDYWDYYRMDWDY